MNFPLTLKSRNNNLFTFKYDPRINKLIFVQRHGKNYHTFSFKEIEHGRLYTKYGTEEMRIELRSNLKAYREIVVKFKRLAFLL